jgi:hypothetical protein
MRATLTDETKGLCKRAVLHLEMPSSCKDCRLTNIVYHFGNMYFCTAVESKDRSKNTEDETKRPNWCPLIPVREPDVKIEMKNYSTGRYAEDYE